MTPLTVTRTPINLSGDSARVISRPFIPGGKERVDAILERVLSVSDSQVSSLLDRLLRDYGSRHKNIEEVFDRHYCQVESRLDGLGPVSRDRRLLIGAYFTMEYSLESVALFNPSMVLHPDQSGLASGEARFVMSLRACGEGHISAIEFRSGVINANNGVRMDPVSRFAVAERPVEDKLYNTAKFFRKLIEMGAYNPLANGILSQLDDEFTIDQLRQAIDSLQPEAGYRETYQELAQNMMWLAHSSYHLRFSRDTELCERVIFPVNENESRGIEDARFVRFTDDDGSRMYYATYTAYNGIRTLPQFLETSDFSNFNIYALSGKCVQNKGMALFPRKIGGAYYMISRLDGENIYVLRSDDIHLWSESQKVRTPMQPWEFIQIGNCGSPIETDRGWLMLTHGVGPLRQYWLGALLLDLEDPARVIGHLEEPMLVPTEEERDGYVPNVVYSCGTVLHQGYLFIPYAIADTSSSIAKVSLSELLSHMRKP
ncbi:MAG: glycoside hydrolase family 130 protein [Planctomycetota bacterium]